jgi:hypothetical protein
MEVGGEDLQADMEWPSRRDLIIKLRPQPPVAPRTKNVCLGCVEVDILILCWWTFPEVKQSLSVKVVSERKIEMIVCMSCDEKKKMLRTFALLYTQTASASRCLQQMVDRALIGSTTAGARKCRAAPQRRATRSASVDAWRKPPLFTEPKALHRRENGRFESGFESALP